MGRVQAADKGFSLIELMVAMTIGLFLSLGLFTMLSMSLSNVISTSHLNQLQENGQTALSLMQRDLSLLGFMGDATGSQWAVRDARINANRISDGSDCVGAGLNNASLPNSSIFYFRRVWGYEQGKGTEFLSCLANVKNNTDVIQIKRLKGVEVPLSDIKKNRYYMNTSTNEAVIFSGDQEIPVVAAGRIWEYQHHVYYIEEDGSIPTLKRRVLRNGGMKVSSSYEQIVQGVEQIRVLYGLDSNGDNSADSFFSAENVTPQMWDFEGNNRLVALRLFLLIRSINEDPGFTNNSAYTLGDKTIAAANDHYRRKVFASTIVLENPLLTDIN